MIHSDLSDRVAVVTGASRGIGKHIAAALHRAGASVAITGRRAETLEAAARATGERCRPYVCDQRAPEAIEAMAQAVVADLGAPDILVNNAAAVKLGTRVAELPLEVWNKVIDTGLTGVFLTPRAFLPAMFKKERADIFMISSMSGKKGDPGGAAYAACKFGLQGFSQALMYEVRGQNIRVMVLNPSSVDTGEDTGPRFGKGLYLHAADIAATIVHLACLPGRTMIRDMDIYGTNPR
jgi:NAD(P)-dependent dehydrogenase (short-subunit alcohol dehydrogenase family)